MSVVTSGGPAAVDSVVQGSPIVAISKTHPGGQSCWTGDPSFVVQPYCGTAVGQSLSQDGRG